MEVMNAKENAVALCRYHHFGGTWYTFLWNGQAYLQNCMAYVSENRNFNCNYHENVEIV